MGGHWEMSKGSIPSLALMASEGILPIDSKQSDL